MDPSRAWRRNTLGVFRLLHPLCCYSFMHFIRAGGACVQYVQEMKQICIVALFNFDHFSAALLHWSFNEKQNYTRDAHVHFLLLGCLSTAVWLTCTGQKSISTSAFWQLNTHIPPPPPPHPPSCAQYVTGGNRTERLESSLTVRRLMSVYTFQALWFVIVFTHTHTHDSLSSIYPSLCSFSGVTNWVRASVYTRRRLWERERALNVFRCVQDRPQINEPSLSLISQSNGMI